jgi:glycosyltransferase involved in cell wall biosynthesis
MVKKKVIFIVPYPRGEAASQRFRFEQYLQTMHRLDYITKVLPFWSEAAWKILYKPGRKFQKMLFLFVGFINRIISLFIVIGFDHVFIHREAAPIGPPILEWIVAKVMRKKIIYDFDDAIWLTDKNENLFEKIIRFRTKVKHICCWSYKVSCGNEYLCNYARQFNTEVVLNPTTIDLESLQRHSIKREHNNNKVVLGWTGSHTTLKYLDELYPVLLVLEKLFPELEFLVIADKKPALNLQSLRFKPWSKKSEVEDLVKIDIGVMPLPDDQWSRGKCGFKILQYMALGIPSVASPVGVNSTLIQNGVNGFLCATNDEWKSVIERLVHDHALRKMIGDAGHATMARGYSVTANTKNFLSLFN